MKLILAAAEVDYYRERVAPHVDGRQIVYAGEVNFAEKVALYGGARALLYPIQAREPFGLVLAEAMACGTPVAALDRGAVREVVDDGVTGIVFENLEQMSTDLHRVLALDRKRVHDRAVARFGVARMVDEYVAVYTRLVEAHRARQRA
jgi:glycosyltransferase involved in cell wall biosynthesis